MFYYSNQKPTQIFNWFLSLEAFAIYNFVVFFCFHNYIIGSDHFSVSKAGAEKESIARDKYCFQLHNIWA